MCVTCPGLRTVCLFEVLAKIAVLEDVATPPKKKRLHVHAGNTPYHYISQGGESNPHPSFMLLR